MKFETLISKLKDIEDYGIQSFWQKDFIGSCPCFSGFKTIGGKKVYVRGRCWRVSDNAQDLYVWGDLKKNQLKLIGKEVKRALDAQEWYNKYTLMIKPFNI